MAPLAENLTPRLFIDYTSEGQQHVMQVRLAIGSGEPEAIAMYNAITGALAPQMWNQDSFRGARLSAANSTLSFPIAVDPVAGTNPFAPGVGKEPAFWSLTGRDTLGRRVRCTFFSPYVPQDEEYRDVVSAQPNINGWRNALIQTAGGARSVSGSPVVWNNYVNIGFNAYYQRKKRRTG